MTKSIRSAALVAFLTSLDREIGLFIPDDRELPKRFTMPESHRSRHIVAREPSTLVRDPARRAPAVLHMSTLLKECGWRGTDEERLLRAAELLDEAPDAILDEWAKTRAAAIARAETKRRRKGLKRLEEKP